MQLRLFGCSLARPYMVPDFSIWEKYMFGLGGQHDIEIRNSHMDKMTRAIVIRRLLLEALVRSTSMTAERLQVQSDLQLP